LAFPYDLGKHTTAGDVGAGRASSAISVVAATLSERNAAFQNGERAPHTRLPNQLKASDLGRSVDGAVLAIVLGMDNKNTTRRLTSLTSLLRVIRAFVGASLLALGFAFAILLLGIPLALFVRGLYEGLSWLVRLGGDTPALVEALVSIGSIAGGLILAAMFVRLLVGLFDWRRRLRARVSNGHTLATRLHRPETAGAA
jgi:hypothetical protein